MTYSANLHLTAFEPEPLPDTSPRQPPSRGCWRFGAFELDADRFELRRDGQRLIAPPKVLDLLIFLVRNHWRLVGKDELLDNVWPDVTVSEGSLSQAVSLARKLLGDSPQAQAHLRTVRGRGFHFVAPVERLR